MSPVSKSSDFKVEARCVRLAAKADDVASLAPAVERRAISHSAEQVLIEVKAAAVNPSDVKAATGLMPYAVFPRTPGRDYAGVVIDGPAGSVGREVFGSSGDLGIRRDGTNATHLAVELEAVVEFLERASCLRLNKLRLRGDVRRVVLVRPDAVDDAFGQIER